MGGIRWQYCIDHYDEDVSTFFSSHFREKRRKCLFIGGGGFDPRSTVILTKLSQLLGKRLHALLIREERPGPDVELVARAEKNLEQISQMSCTNQSLNIDIFSDDNAVVGGINILSAIEKLSFEKYTDIILDLSALSIGISFPIAAYIYNRALKLREQINVHLTVTASPTLDRFISSSPNDRVTDIRGFSVPNLLGEAERAKLWLPLISSGKGQILSRIHSNEQPHDTCPIFPFPSEDPRKTDQLALEYIPELENDWNVDPRNFVYADERKPLDIYRIIMRIDRERKPVFKTFGGSMIILSPLGGRMPATGMLMAALECQFPVVYVETMEYHVDWNQVDSMERDQFRMAHIWLYGEAYHRDTIQWQSG